jgi:thiol-disulfide isomerase/thioredoxin
MQKFLSLNFSLLAFVSLCFGQNQPVPEYVAKQNFPDSVATVSMVTLEGTRMKFSDMLKFFRGKKIVIDIWASWCKDCIVGLPKLEELRKKTSSDKVVYVFLSVDDNDAKWRAAINRFRIKGEHYRIESGWKNPLANYIVLDWVPRYLVLNEAGHVIVPKAIVADDQLLEKSLLQ